MISLDELNARLGREASSTQPEGPVDLSAVSLIDVRAGTSGGFAATLSPHSVSEVVHILRWAHETGTRIVPAGHRSGVCGGVAAGDDLVLLDLSGLDHIGDLDEKSLTVTVQAGVRGSVLEARLNETGYTLGHAPQSIDISSVGGWLATRACGQLSAHYGGIEDIVVGLDAVLPGGISVSSKNQPRRSAGPEVARLLIGSEGTLGVVVSATMRISHLPSETARTSFLFEHMADGVAACRALAQSELHPSLVRLYDRDDAAIFWRHSDVPPEGPVLLVAFFGYGADDRLQAARELVSVPDAGESNVAYWWDHRNDAARDYEGLMTQPGVLGAHPLIDTMEVSGTWSVLRDLYHSTKESMAPVADIVGCHLSHIYPTGACLYFTLASACASDDDARTLHAKWWDLGPRTCLAAGGSISHHHGIGRLKANWLEAELGSEYGLLRKIKAALDPKRIMNPGALGL